MGHGKSKAPESIEVGVIHEFMKDEASKGAAQSKPLIPNLLPHGCTFGVYHGVKYAFVNS